MSLVNKIKPIRIIEVFLPLNPYYNQSMHFPLSMNKITQYIPILICFIATALFFSYPLGDADFGWHLRYGEYFLKTGEIMRDNQFSWQLPDYQWTNHSWGFDVFIAWIFNGHQFALVSLVGGLLVAISIFLLLPQAYSLSTGIALIVFWLFGNQLIDNGLRSQYFSLLATAFLWRLIQQYIQPNHQPLPQKLFILLPLLFTMWANLHGQFMLGIGVLGLACMVRFIQTKKTAEKIQITFLVSLSITATLINPFTYRLWSTTIDHFNAPELKYINEWSPWPLANIRMLFLLAYTGIFWYGAISTRQSRTLLLPLAALTILALTQRRIIPYFLLTSLPILQAILDQMLIKKVPISQLKTLVWTSAILLGTSAFFIVSSRQLFNQNWDRYCHTNVYCSEKVVDFMRNHHIQGKLWTAYRLGGHLIYRIPEIKPMVDGRMTIWRRPDGSSPFMEYTTMVYSFPGAKQLFDKMNPDYVLIQPQYALAKILASTEKWPIIFTDEQVILFQNPQSTSSATISH